MGARLELHVSVARKEVHLCGPGRGQRGSMLCFPMNRSGRPEENIRKETRQLQGTYALSW